MLLIFYLKFKLSNQKGLFVPRDNVIFCRVTSPVFGFRARDVILNLSNCDSKLISRDVSRELRALIKNIEKWRQLAQASGKVLFRSDDLTNY